MFYSLISQFCSVEKPHPRVCAGRSVMSLLIADISKLNSIILFRIIMGLHISDFTLCERHEVTALRCWHTYWGRFISLRRSQASVKSLQHVSPSHIHTSYTVFIMASHLFPAVEASIRLVSVWSYLFCLRISYFPLRWNWYGIGNWAGTYEHLTLRYSLRITNF
jgi:hypothetical protein